MIEQIKENIFDGGLSPSGKAQDFDSCISLVRIPLAQLKAFENAEFSKAFLFAFFPFQLAEKGV